jgi:hypothetical protein
MNKSTNADGPSVKQSLRDFQYDNSCFMLLFMHIRSVVLVLGPFLIASAVVMWLTGHE